MVDVEQTIREWNELNNEREKLRTENAKLTGRCQALEESLKTANRLVERLRMEGNGYMKIAIEAVAANNDAQQILAAAVNKADSLANRLVENGPRPASLEDLGDDIDRRLPS